MPSHTKTATAALCVLALLATYPAAGADAAELHLFDPVLSLTGDCSVSAVDEVPDPGCPAGPNPASAFVEPEAVATDPHGDIYVANLGAKEKGKGVIDVFDNGGRFLTEVAPEEPEKPSSVAVDSKGYLYVFTFDTSSSTNEVYRYKPEPYEPEAVPPRIAYPNPPVPIVENIFSPGTNLAVNPADDHLFVEHGTYVEELNSAEEGNVPISEEIGAGVLHGGQGIGLAIDAAHNRLYVNDQEEGTKRPLVRAFELQAPHALVLTLDGSGAPPGKWHSAPTAAANEATGAFYVFDSGERSSEKIYEFDEGGSYLQTIDYAGIGAQGGPAKLTVDNGAHSPNGAEDPEGRYIYLPSPQGTPGHLLAFAPTVKCAPQVKSLAAARITDSEAQLRATVNPCGDETAWRIEYTTEASFQTHGFEGARLAGSGTLAASKTDQGIAASLSGLAPGGAYRYRMAVSNSIAQDEAEGRFSTYPAPVPWAPCANDPVRGGPSAVLPDCRAYELVTPADTNGHSPFGLTTLGIYFPSTQSSPDGERVSFQVQGGALPGFEGTGSLAGDPYLARRSSTGWQTESAGARGSEASVIRPGSPSADQGYSFWEASEEGSALIEGRSTIYLRYPDGHSELLGRGSIGTELLPEGLYIAEGGAHVLFSNGSPQVRLEPAAPPDGTAAIYDRTPDGVNHVVSLLPGEVTPGEGEDASYLGASLDGRGVAFQLGGVLYLRHDDAETYEGVPQALTGHQLSCALGSLAGGSTQIEWLRDGAPIPGATSANYTPQAADAGSELQCVVHAQNAEGGAIAASDPLLVGGAHHGGPVPRSGTDPTLSGAASVGGTLSCDPKTWSAGASLSFQWYRNGAPIASATEETYEVKAADKHTVIQCGVQASAGGAVVSAFSSGLEAQPPIPPSGGTPAILNLTDEGQAPQLGDRLECKAGAWQGSPTFSYRWLRNGTQIATTSTYTVAAADEGTAMQCEVSAENAAGTAEALSGAEALAPLLPSELPAGSLSVKGTFAVGKALECEPGSWANSPSFSYRWLRNGAPIAAATASTYTLTAADRETVVQCELTASNAKGGVLALDGGFVNAKPRPQASVPPLDAIYAGISEGGGRIFYLQGGDLYAFDAGSEETISFTASGDVTPVNVSADGTSAYFVSPSVLVAEDQPNPHGDLPVEGEENLYRSHEGQISFLATVTERDVEGEGGGGGDVPRDGLGLWGETVANGTLAVDPSRTTPDGQVLLFQSRADLTGYDPEGHSEIYRYSAAEGSLACLSCNPTGAAARGDASLQSIVLGLGAPEPLNRYDKAGNLRAGGRRAFFQSPDPLVLGDSDGVQDVYEWEAAGIGSCHASGGCVYLISSGQSARPNYLFATSADGRDVFIQSPDLLVPGEDSDETPSIYDARVEGGFPPPPTAAAECLGEACQPVARALGASTPASAAFQGPGDAPAPRKRCLRGKRRVKRHGRTVCRKRGHHRKHHRHRGRRAHHRGRSPR